MSHSGQPHFSTCERYWSDVPLHELNYYSRQAALDRLIEAIEVWIQGTTNPNPDFWPFYGSEDSPW